MSKNQFAKVYAASLAFLFFVGGIILVCLPVFSSNWDGAFSVLAGMVLSIIITPIVHELGHIIFAFWMKMQTLYAKFFCVKMERLGGRYAFSVAAPWLADETKVVAKNGEDIERRMKRYALGGLVFEGVFFVVVLIISIMLSCFHIHNGTLWGMVPYTAYHFLLNIVPFEYPSGKTDTCVYLGITKGANAERLLLSIMEIQAFLYEGVRYSEMKEELFEFPVVAEDDPLFVIGLDLCYRRALDCGNYELAGATLQRMIDCAEYASPFVAQKIAAETVYVYTLFGVREQANGVAKHCEEYLKSNRLDSMRILATIAYCDGRFDEFKILKAQARKLLEREEIVGERLFEEKLLSLLADKPSMEE